MKRTIIALAGVVSLGVFALPAASTALAGQSGSEYGHSLCEQNALTCTEISQQVAGYTGHDEPSALFYSNTAGSGNNNVYTLRLPTDPPKLPRQDGTGGTFNFQLHPAFWFGMAMCDDQSAPNPGGSSVGANVPCTADSDSNIFTSDSTTNANYIGLHPGTAFMEMQFYPPGFAPWPAGNSCAATLWCAALNIDSLSQNMNAGTQLNSTCAATTGIEYVNFAFITKNGVSQAPANPVDSTLATFTPNRTKDLFMHSGDSLQVSLGDTSNGFQVIINDLSTGQHGSMTASAANGFGEVQYNPAPSTACVNIPTNFHPEYSTSSENTRVPWAAHTYNVAFADEIGHFEYCSAETGGACTAASATDPSGPDGDDVGCFSPGDTTRIRIGGCLGTDGDFDGPEYANNWPGTLTNAAQDAQLHASPIAFTSPTFNGGSSFGRVAFEADLPRIEGGTTPPCQRHFANPADPSPGSGCVDPPVGASFYPFFSTTSIGGQCYWQLGGDNIAGTTNDFGGSSTAEYGALLVSDYPTFFGGAATVTLRSNNFRQVLTSNPC